MDAEMRALVAPNPAYFDFVQHERLGGNKGDGIFGEILSVIPIAFKPESLMKPRFRQPFFGTRGLQESRSYRWLNLTLQAAGCPLPGGHEGSF
ncbi:MAG: hypothetical protein CTY19_16515 [Methylomonas sp.]|nr:MAG: hypothetical protein CTY19_16515 [Methylomonas sp.]